MRRRDRPGQHEQRVVPDDREAVEPGPRREAELLRHRLAHDQGAARGIRQGRRVARGDLPIDLRKAQGHLFGVEGRLELGERRGGRLGADGLVGVDHAAVGQGHRQQLAREGSGCRGRRRTPVRLGGELVELGAVEVPLGRDQLGRDALVHQPLRVARRDARTERRRSLSRRAERHPAHHLDAGRDDDVVRAGDHALRGEVRGLLARAALAIDRDSGHALVEAGGEQRVARHVAALLAGLADASHQHVVDLHRLQAVALEQGAQHVGEQIGGVGLREGAARLALAGCGSHDIHDYCVVHVTPRSASVRCGFDATLMQTKRLSMPPGE